MIFSTNTIFYFCIRFFKENYKNILAESLMLVGKSPHSTSNGGRLAKRINLKFYTYEKIFAIRLNASDHPGLRVFTIKNQYYYQVDDY